MGLIYLEDIIPRTNAEVFLHTTFNEKSFAHYDNLIDAPKEYRECIVEGIEPSAEVDYPALAVYLDEYTVKQAELRIKTNERDQIIWGENYDFDKYLGGCRHFEGVGILELEALLDAGFLDPEETQNGSPTVREMMSFVRHCDVPTDWEFEGYAISPERDDYRVTIEGLYYNGTNLTLDELLAFTNEFHWADEFEVAYDYARAWWD